MDIHKGSGEHFSVNDVARVGSDACRSITIFGSTGTIGCQTLDVIDRHRDRYTLVALTAQKNVAKLAEQAVRFGAQRAVIGDSSKFAELKSLLSGTNVEAAAGTAALEEAAYMPADIVMAAIVGVAGLRPTYAAVSQGKRVALANKECLVSAGHVFMRQVAQAGGELLPVDSEHSAVFQALGGAQARDIRKIVLTASGGPFREWSLADIEAATPAQALRHPTWNMGQKISIDSASLMNKGLELIEAFHLFPVAADQLGVIVHPQSIIHSFVEFADGSHLAQLGLPDMRTPIAYSLAWPERVELSVGSLSVSDFARMTFEEPDEKRFPALRIARSVLNEGGTAGAVFNAANEIAVEAFLSEAIGFMSISNLVEATLDRCVGELQGIELGDIEDVISVDQTARRVAQSLISSMT